MVNLLYKNPVAAIRAIGKIISKKRGNASNVKIQNAELDAPDSITSSKKRSDCVNKITAASVNAMKIVAIERLFNI